jgi:acyl-CoA reductase-like NAD-dependent aldehyde dehydrogenase
MLKTETHARGHFIGGEELPGSNGEHLDVFRPATGDVIARTPIGTDEDIGRAVQAAEQAFREWSRKPPASKERVLRQIAARIEAERESLAQLERANTGKRMDVALEEIDGAAELFAFYAGYPSKDFGDQIPIADPAILCYTRVEPVGVVGAITPWNYPLLIIAGKVAAALAAGCTVVAKPAPETPLTAIELARICRDAGLPDGALNVVTGDGTTGSALAHHPRIGKISFTGSTATGRRVLAASGANGRPGTLELGGKSPNVVFADIDLAASIDSILMGALTNAGQECCAGARVLVQEEIFDEFVELAGARIEQLRVGFEGDSEIGPLISRRQHERVSGFVERALADGARLGAEGASPNEGFFFPPTMLVDVKPEMEACREEIFGPVLTIDTFGDDEEALRKANDTPYGLAAGLWTGSIDRSIRFASELEAGLVWVNSYLAGDTAAPFGGNKASGFGRELGLEGPKEFSQVKTVYVSGPPAG